MTQIRTRTRAALSALAFAALLAACGSDSEGAAKAAKNTTAASSEGATASTVIVASPEETPALPVPEGEEVTVVEEAPASEGEAAPEPTAAVTDAVEALQGSIAEATGLDASAGTDGEYVLRVIETGEFSYEAPARFGATASTTSGMLQLSSSTSYNDWVSALHVGLRVDRAQADVLADLTAYFRSRCSTLGESAPYQDDRYTGVSQTFVGCPKDVSIVFFVVQKPGGADQGYIIGTINDAQDLADLGHAIRTFTF